MIKKIAHKFLLGLGVLTAMGAAVAVASIYDARIEAAVYRIMDGASVLWHISADSNGRLVFLENSSSNRNLLVIDDNTGGVGIRGYTNGEIPTLTPNASGQMIINITNGNVCIATGTVAGSWAVPSTYTAITMARRDACAGGPGI